MYKETLSILTDIAWNNNKGWSDANRKRCEVVRSHFAEIVEETITELTKYDRNFKGLLAKDCIFRLNKYIRFSKNKCPYKLSFSVFSAKGGTASLSSNRALITGQLKVAMQFSLTNLKLWSWSFVK